MRLIKVQKKEWLLVLILNQNDMKTLHFVIAVGIAVLANILAMVIYDKFVKKENTK